MQPDKSERLALGSERYGSLKNDGGCAQCGHSFYQHSTGYDNQWHCKPGCKCDGFYIANAGPMRCSCGGRIEKIGDDRFECDDCGQLYEKDDWRADRLKAIQNANGCPICNAKVTTADALESHLKSAHGLEGQDLRAVMADSRARGIINA